METFFRSLLFLSLSLFQYFSATYSTTLTITNNCNDIIWPVVSPNSGDPTAPSGFALFPGHSQTLTSGPAWSGRVWARTHCSTSPTGNFLCATGDCNTGTVECSAARPSPPATVAEFTPATYSVSVVDGYNLPVVVVPGGRGCTTVGCVVDYGGAYYPPELRASYGGAGNGSEEVVGIKSACTAFGEAQYCCSGSYSSESNCKPNSYSELFKKWCPQARTYAFDGVGTTFSCDSVDFVVNFCSPPTSDGGTGNPGIGNPNDGSDDYGKNKLDYKFIIIITIVVAILGTFSIWYIWRKCFRPDCDTCTFSCCSLFSCSFCIGGHHHSDKC